MLLSSQFSPISHWLLISAPHPCHIRESKPQTIAASNYIQQYINSGVETPYKEL